MTTLLETLVEKTAALRAPFPGDAPSGEDIGFDPEFEIVKTEIDKLSSLTGGEVAWRKVVPECERLLKTRSKDLRLLVWMTIGRGQLSGWAGQAEGLVVLRDVCHSNWDTMYPPVKRLAGRANLVTWMLEQLDAKAQNDGVDAESAEAVRAVESLVRDLDGSLGAKLGDKVTFGPYKRTLREKTRDLPAEAVEAPAEAVAEAAATVDVAPEAAPMTSGAVAAPTAGAAPPVRATGDGPADVRAAAQALVRAAVTLRKADPASAWAARALRQGLWLALPGGLPAKDDKTSLAAPAPAVVKRLTDLVAGEEWSVLLEEGETLLVTNPYWIDLQRYVATALDELGGLFAKAREAVGRETVHLLAREPRLHERTFANGTPLADEQTIAWVAREALRWAYRGDLLSRMTDAFAVDVAERLDVARSLVAAGDVGAGLRLANQLAERAGSGREKFRVRVSFARLLVQAKALEAAKGQLNPMFTEADGIGLDKWEPELAADMYCAYLETMAAEGGSDYSTLEKLWRLDPEAALRLTPPA